MNFWTWFHRNRAGARYVRLVTAWCAFVTVAVRHWTPDAAPCICPPAAEATK